MTNGGGPETMDDIAKILDCCLARLNHSRQVVLQLKQATSEEVLAQNLSADGHVVEILENFVM